MSTAGWERHPDRRPAQVLLDMRIMQLRGDSPRTTEQAPLFPAEYPHGQQAHWSGVLVTSTAYKSAGQLEGRPAPSQTAPVRQESAHSPDNAFYKKKGLTEIVPRDLRMKDKFLKHLTGPLYFSPKCSKHFHRLYHNTRDCTIPAYYKRCARLLTRLAVSPMCMEG
ncbi:Protein FAM150B [Heterocephalus glaber]|uniref:Protein FAM150B n=1 Tax=Heterocephalus glaber TaxID=10181 RepID=G5C0X8_HETGA|nr:Protein FAM150B [Heterocephalus glaber]